MSFHRIRIAALAFCAVFSVSLAQDGPPPGGQGGPPPGGQRGFGGPGQRGMRMQANWTELTAKLHLTDDQVTKLKAAVKSHMEKMRALMTDQSQSREQKQAAARSNQDAFKTTVKGILNEDQFKTLDDMGGPRRLMGGPPTPLEVLSTLGITEDQKAKAKAIFDEERAAFNAIFQDESVSPEDRRSKMLEIHKAAMDKLKAVLTDEQFTKFQSMMMQRGPGGPGGRRGGGFGPPGGQGGPGGRPPGGQGGPPPDGGPGGGGEI